MATPQFEEQLPGPQPLAPLLDLPQLPVTGEAAEHARGRSPRDAPTRPMALHSMTGFGAGSAEAALDDGSTLTVGGEVRTVNHRHLQTKLRLPQELSSLEHSLDARIRGRVNRGALQASFGRRTQRRGAADRHRPRGRGALHRDPTRPPGALRPGPVASTAELLALPGVLVQGTRRGAAAAEDGPEAEVVRRALDAALDAPQRCAPGRAKPLVADMRTNMTAIGVLVDRIGSLAPKVVERHRQRLVERVSELSASPRSARPTSRGRSRCSPTASIWRRSSAA